MRSPRTFATMGREGTRMLKRKDAAYIELNPPPAT